MQIVRFLRANEPKSDLKTSKNASNCAKRTETSRSKGEAGCNDKKSATREAGLHGTPAKQGKLPDGSLPRRLQMSTTGYSDDARA